MKNLFTIIILFLLARAGYAQTGTIKGNIKDAKTGEAIIGGTVQIKGTTIGAATDVEGNFVILNASQGTVTLTISFISYKTLEISDVNVVSGKTTVINTFLEESISELTEVEITAERRKNTDVAVITEIKQAEVVAVGVSSQQISRTQDRDASQVLRRIPGVSIIDNRFINVRGLGQRYNAVLLNGILAPSSEVDMKSFSFDLVPSNVIDRLLIYKSGAGELPGEFAGGIIQLYTKNIINQNFSSLGFSFGYRQNTTFREVERNEGTKYDFIGLGNKERKLPGNFPSFLSSGINRERRAEFGKQLSNSWTTSPYNVIPDFRINFNLGRKLRLGNKTLSNLTSVNYSNTHQFYQPDLKAYQDFDPSVGSSPVATAYKDDFYRNDVRIGLIHNWFIRLNNKNSVEFKNLYNQLSYGETVIRSGNDFTTGVEEERYSFRYENRSIYSGQLVGSHQLGKSSDVNWQLGFGYTNRKEPDWRRFSRNRVIGELKEDGTPVDFGVSFPGSVTAFDLSRYFSDLNEFVNSGSFKFEQKLGKNENEELLIKLRAGVYVESKNREFKSRLLGYTSDNLSTSIGEYKYLPFDQIFAPEHIGGTGFNFSEGTNTNDSYDASNFLFAGYLSSYIPFSSKFSGSLGLRSEFNNQDVQSGRYSGGEEIVSILPSLNLSYKISTASILRLAYSKSLNRPEFRELAPFNYFEFNINSNIVGNPILKHADIHNVDFRWEIYPSDNELISLGVFYKNFSNPIESYLLIGSGGSSSLNYGFANAKNADAYGIEAEIKKSFYELSSNRFIQNLNFVANASYIYTKVESGKYINVGAAAGGKMEVDNRNSRRPMVGQSPYLINAGLYYDDVESGFQTTILYNVIGPRIFAVGNINNETVYEMPRNVIDLSINKKLKNGLEFRAGVQDILNQKVRLTQDSNVDNKITNADEDVRSFRRGAAYSLGVSYNF